MFSFRFLGKKRQYNIKFPTQRNKLLIPSRLLSWQTVELLDQYNNSVFPDSDLTVVCTRMTRKLTPALPTSSSPYRNSSNFFFPVVIFFPSSKKPDAIFTSSSCCCFLCSFLNSFRFFFSISCNLLYFPSYDKHNP